GTSEGNRATTDRAGHRTPAPQRRRSFLYEYPGGHGGAFFHGPAEGVTVSRQSDCGGGPSGDHRARRTDWACSIANGTAAVPKPTVRTPRGENTRSNTLSQEDISSGKMLRRGFVFSKTCELYALPLSHPFWESCRA